MNFKCGVSSSSSSSLASTLLETDSGYVSHNNLDSMVEAVTGSFLSVGSGGPVPGAFVATAATAVPPSRHNFFDEDALLERPTFLSLDGNDFQSSSADDNESIVIPYVPPIVYNGGGVLSNVTNTVQSFRTPEKRANFLNASSTSSPDLFSDGEASTEKRRFPQAPLPSFATACQSSGVPQELYTRDVDEELLGRIKEGLKGMYPPPSVTLVHFTLDEMLARLHTNGDLFATRETLKASVALKRQQMRPVNDYSSLLVTGTQEQCTTLSWPLVMMQRYHGLYHNRSKVSEEIEIGCIKYGQRYVGAETQCTCTVFEPLIHASGVVTTRSGNSPSRQQPQHLLRLPYRAPNGAGGSAKSPGRRLSHLARRRISFSSTTLQTATHSSIVGSRARQILVDARRVTAVIDSAPPPSTVTSSGVASGGVTDSRRPAKRQLFTSPKQPFTNETTMKRLRLDDSSSQSSEGAAPSDDLSDLHRKKLQWAVYEALRSQGVNGSHTHFKQYASTLARVTRRCLLLQNGVGGSREGGGTSERMLRIARRHVYAVTKGRTVDDILAEYSGSAAAAAKTGGPNAFSSRHHKMAVAVADKENVQVGAAPSGGNYPAPPQCSSSDKRRLAALACSPANHRASQRGHAHNTNNSKNSISERRIERIRKVITFDDNTL